MPPGPSGEGFAVQTRVGDRLVQAPLSQYLPEVKAVICHPVCTYVGMCGVQNLADFLPRVFRETACKVRQEQMFITGGFPGRLRGWAVSGATNSSGQMSARSSDISTNSRAMIL